MGESVAQGQPLFDAGAGQTGRGVQGIGDPRQRGINLLACSGSPRDAARRSTWSRRHAQVRRSGKKAGLLSSKPQWLPAARRR